MSREFHHLEISYMLFLPNLLLYQVVHLTSPFVDELRLLPDMLLLPLILVPFHVDCLMTYAFPVVVQIWKLFVCRKVVDVFESAIQCHRRNANDTRLPLVAHDTAIHQSFTDLIHQLFAEQDADLSASL